MTKQMSNDKTNLVFWFFAFAVSLWMNCESYVYSDDICKSSEKKLKQNTDVYKINK